MSDNLARNAKRAALGHKTVKKQTTNCFKNC